MHNVEDGSLTFLGRFPDCFYAHTDFDLLGVNPTDQVHDAHQRVRAIDIDHSWDLWLGQVLHIPGHITEREGVDRTGVG